MPAEQRIALITERLIIASEQFKGITPLARHRLVYDLVNDLIPYPVHALAIQAKTNS